MMSITLFKENYEFHLASRIENGTPGDYLTGEILLPEHSDSVRRIFFFVFLAMQCF